MNRQQRRAKAIAHQQRRAAKATGRKRRRIDDLEVGDMIRVQTITIIGDAGRHYLYWFECPEGWSPADGLMPPDMVTKHYATQMGLPDSAVNLHGPFDTHAEVKEHQRITLLGPEAELREGGEWDPAWDKPQ
jgi:hypothetical protein